MSSPTIFPHGIICQGPLTVTGDILPLRPRSEFLQEDLAVYPIPWTAWRVWDALQTNLPGTAAADDLALIGGTFGSASPVIRSSDGKATTITQYARCQVALPPEYVAGQTVNLRLHCGMITTISDGTATVDVSAYASDSEAGVGADLVTTAAQSINSLTDADKTFVIDATGLVVGSLLDIRIAISITDAATGTAVVGQVGSVQLLLDIKG